MPNVSRPKTGWLTLGGSVLTVAVLAIAAGTPDKRAPNPAAPDALRFGPAGSAPVVDRAGPRYRLFSRPEPGDDHAAAGSSASEGSVPIDGTGAAMPPGPVPVIPRQQRGVATSDIPDGDYACKTWSGSSYIGLGTLRSTNGSLANGVLSETGATITGAVPTADGVTLSYTSGRGSRESVDCVRQ